MQGAKLICPNNGFELDQSAPAGRLDGLMCYSASAPELITDATPMANITSIVHIEHHGLSSGAVAGIVILVLVLVGGLAGEAASTKASVGFVTGVCRYHRHATSSCRLSLH